MATLGTGGCGQRFAAAAASGLQLDERAMARQTTSWSKELDLTNVGRTPLGKRMSCWKKPMAEAAIATDPPKNLAD